MPAKKKRIEHNNIIMAMEHWNTVQTAHSTGIRIELLCWVLCLIAIKFTLAQTQEPRAKSNKRTRYTFGIFDIHIQPRKKFIAKRHFNIISIDGKSSRGFCLLPK